MGDRIKFLGIVGLQTSHLLLTESLNKNNESNLKTELINLIPTLNKLNLTPQDFQKIHTSNGTWFCSIDTTKTAILILSSNSYPVGSVMRLQKEILNEIIKIPRYFDPETTNLKEISKTDLYNLLKNYDINPEYNDTIIKIQDSVDKVKNQMEDNIKTMFDNQDSLEQIDTNSRRLNEFANKFRNAASNVKDKIYKEKNFQLFVIGTIGIILLIIFIMMIRTII